MKNSAFNKKLFLFGFILWIIPFVLAIPLFQLFGDNRIVFKSVICLVLALTIMGVWNKYLQNISSDFLTHSYVASVTWILMSIIPDLFAFLLGFQMSAVTYFTEIATSYLLIPILLIGNALLLQKYVAK
jgi:hypothetical protein